MTAVEPQVAAETREQLIRQLADVGGIQAPDGGAARGAVTVRIPAEALEEATNRLAGTAGVRLADMFAGGSGGSSPPGQRGRRGFRGVAPWGRQRRGRRR